jgi:hypothetical protein
VTHRYVRSTDGNNSDDGLSWANADLDGSGAAAVDAAGDTIWFSQNHNESTASSITWTLAGVLGNPVRVWCGNDAAEPPTSLATTAVVTTTGASSITITGSCDVRGITFNCGTGASFNSGIMLGPAGGGQAQFYSDCKFFLFGTSTALRINLGATGTYNPINVDLEDCEFKVAHATHSFVIGHGKVRLRGLVAASGGTTPNFLFRTTTQRGMDFSLIGGDLSALGAGVHMFEGGGGADSTGLGVIAGVKLPASWTGDLVSAAVTLPGARYEMHACDNADGMFYERVADAYGRMREETVLTRSGGRTVPNSLSGGTDPQPLSLKLDGTSHLASWPSEPFRIRLAPIWNETTGSSVTVTLPFLIDSASDWNNNDIVLRVSYPGTAGEAKYSHADSGPSDVLATPAAITAASSGWTTTDMTNPKQRKLEVSVTPQEKGFLLVEVLLYKRAVVYIDKATKA